MAMIASSPRGSEVHGIPRTAPAPLSRAVLEFNATLVSRQDLSELGVADRVPASLFFEQYDTAPIFPAEQLEALRQVLLARSR